MVLAIVIITYNRTLSLTRILSSIANANYSGFKDIPLIISIDGGESSGDVEAIARNFHWSYGIKKVIRHENNLGLKKHVISCGDLTEQYENVILLEDDLFVSPYFYDYAYKSMSYYKDSPQIAGVSLYSYSVNEFVGLPFVPLKSEGDTFFMQIPSSWGQAFSQKQWTNFKAFYDSKPLITRIDKLPESVKSWPETSWKKYFYKYVVDNDLFFVYPFVSYTTNFGDVGTHHKNISSFLQVPLMNREKMFVFEVMSDYSIRYDAYMELNSSVLKAYGIKTDFDFTVDLYGSKQLDLFENEYLFSAKNCNKPLEQFAINLLPIENNILLGLDGNDISFGRKKDFLNKQPFSIYKEIIKAYNYLSYDSGIKTGESSGFIKGQNSVLSTNAYKLGYLLLKPIKWLKSKCY